jgi:hypothetical protein
LIVNIDNPMLVLRNALKLISRRLSFRFTSKGDPSFIRINVELRPLSNGIGRCFALNLLCDPGIVWFAGTCHKQATNDD